MKFHKVTAIFLVLLVLLTAVLSGCGKQAKPSSSGSPKSSAAAQTTSSTTPKKRTSLALTKDDFSYGGKTVNGYTNYIDCIEKSGRENPYWFSEESAACAKANRGVNVHSPANSVQNLVTEKFGKPQTISDDYTLEPVYPHLRATAYCYSFHYNKTTYWKIFCIASQHGGSEDFVQIIFYRFEPDSWYENASP